VSSAARRRRTATTTLTGKKFATTTDVDGIYEMEVPRNGRYVIKAELTGFAAVTQEVMINHFQREWRPSDADG